jgi:hypothetical protein
MVRNDRLIDTTMTGYVRLYVKETWEVDYNRHRYWGMQLWLF